ncbi:hypothetical protein P3L51_14880 [Streptomyces sp. PSRA5]|uniref:hypothetical protein n=1 Tax=Streptomyces panacea TaxID=3035064 RepID=UPI00339CDFF9
MIAALFLALLVVVTVFVTAGLVPALLLLAAGGVLVAACLLLLVVALALAGAVAWWRARPTAPVRDSRTWVAVWWLTAARLVRPARAPRARPARVRVWPGTAPGPLLYRYRYHRKDTQ